MEDITVIIPLYNAEQFVPKLVASLNNQSFKNFKVLFLDDCSSDNTLSVLTQELKNKNIEAEIIKNDKNHGPGYTRNKGVMMAKGDYFAFIDADDFISDNYFHELYKQAKREDADVVVALSMKYWENGNSEALYNFELYHEHVNDQSFLTCLLDFAPHGKLFSRHLWEDGSTEFPEKLRGEDGATIPVLFSRAKKFCFATSAVYYYLQLNVSRSNSDGKYYDDVYQTYEILSTRLTDDIVDEFKCASQIGYGVLMNAIRFGVGNRKLMFYCNAMRKKYPRGYKNKYIKYLPWQKRVFIWCSYHDLFFVERVLIKIARR